MTSDAASRTEPQLVDPDRTHDAIAGRPTDPEAAALAEGFRLLGDPTRIRILYALRAAGELCVGDLSQVVGAPETSVSHALRLLRTAGAVTNRRAGRLMYYSLADHHVRDLLDLARTHHREDQQ